MECYIEWGILCSFAVLAAKLLLTALAIYQAKYIGRNARDGQPVRNNT